MISPSDPDRGILFPEHAPAPVPDYQMATGGQAVPLFQAPKTLRGQLAMPEIREKPASGPGALDGWEAACPCGFRYGSSLLGMAEQAAREHADWHARQ